MYARFSKPRRTILRATGGRWHRYRVFRGLTMVITIGLLLLVPMLGIARFDLFGSEHRALFEPAAPLKGFIAVSVAIFAFYFFTFQINLFAGRMFCGWGCPVGQLNRLADAFGASTKPKQRLFWAFCMGLFAFLLSGAVLLWWMTPAAFSFNGQGWIAWTSLVALAVASALFGWRVGWTFCRKLCPIGLYYSVVQQKRPVGILFDRSYCQDEASCVKACPVDLDPRDLAQEKSGIGGLAIEGLTENSHCLRCGECVEACELVTTKLEMPALSFGRPELAEEGPTTSDLVQIKRTKTTAPLLPLLRDQKASEEAKASNKMGWIISLVGLLLLVAGAAFLVQRSPVQTYQPQQTWTEDKKAPERQSYAPAAGGYPSASIRGRAAPGALIYLEAPPPGEKVQRQEVVLEVPGAAAHFARPRDQLLFTHDGTSLHTMVIEKEGRIQQSVPLVVGSKTRKVRAPPVGRYVLRCTAHDHEAPAHLVVFDHPYVALAGPDGAFSLERVPASSLTLVVETGARSHTKKLELSQGEILELSL